MSTTSVNTTNAINPVLTGLFYEITQDAADYKGLIAAPPRIIDGLSAQYVKASGKRQLNLDQTDEPQDRTKPLSLNAPSRPAGISFTTGTVALQRYAEHVFVNDRVRAHWQASAEIDVYRPALDELRVLVHDVHELATMGTIYSTSGNFGLTADPGNIGTVSTAIIDPINTGKEAVRKAIRRAPNFAFMNTAVANKFILLTEVTKRFVSNAPGGTYATNGILKQFFRDQFELELVIVPGYYENSSGADAHFMGNHIAIVYLEDGYGPSFANTFVERKTGLEMVDGANKSLAGVKTVRTDDPDGEKVIADVMWKVQVENAGAGYLLTDVLS